MRRWRERGRWGEERERERERKNVRERHWKRAQAPAPVPLWVKSRHKTRHRSIPLQVPMATRTFSSTTHKNSNNNKAQHTFHFWIISEKKEAYPAGPHQVRCTSRCLPSQLQQKSFRTNYRVNYLNFWSPHVSHCQPMHHLYESYNMRERKISVCKKTPKLINNKGERERKKKEERENTRPLIYPRFAIPSLDNYIWSGREMDAPWLKPRERIQIVQRVSGNGRAQSNG